MKDIMTTTPLFGIVISFLAIEIGKFLSKKFKLAIFNPFLISVIFVIVVLKGFDIPYDDYMKGGNLLMFFLGPATIVLGILLYKQIEFLKKYFVAVIVGCLVGCIVSAASIVILCKVFNIDQNLIFSLLPKSITTPVGIEMAKMLGVDPSITIVFIAITGTIGGVLSPIICKLSGITDPIAIGVGIGTSTHIIGTAKAVEIGELEGAMSATSIVISALITLVIVPIAVKFI
ncbi:LrgB family protein [Fusobacterium sp. PH5-44]|uniref:LrgB family protein n=1 Tax=unclassified Fusobacterium TaxID=2648384 RepID=UPI003D243B8F